MLSEVKVESHYAQQPYDVRADGKVRLAEDSMVFVYLLEEGKQIGIDDKFSRYMDLFMAKTNPVDGKLLKADLESCQGKISE
mgnify:CR=1 FL=1